MEVELEREVWEALREVIDPELGINIVDLGLVYDVVVRDGRVHVAVTMTTPACPLHAYLTDAIESVLWQKLPRIQGVEVKLVWEPPWHPMMMSEAAKRQLGWNG